MTATKASPFKGGEIVVAVETFAHHAGDVRKGQRFDGGDPLVARLPQLFLPLGQDTEQGIRERLAELHPDPVPAPPPTPVAVRSPIDDADALVAIRDVWHGSDFARAGAIVDKRTVLAKKHPEAFVSMSRGVPRDRAVVALTECAAYGGDGEGAVSVLWRVYAGQWCDRDDPEAVARPAHFVDVEAF